MKMHAERAHSFASMIGLAPRAKKAEGDDAPAPDDKKPDAAKAAGDDAPTDPEKKPDAKKAAAEDGKDCPDCDGDGEDDNGDACDTCDGTGRVAADDTPKAKAKGASESDDDAGAKATKAERKRWGFVMAKAIAEGKVTAACALLHDTPMTAAAIVNTLAALPADTQTKAAGGRLDARMAAAKTPIIAPDGPASEGGPKTEAQALAARMQAAADKARGKASA